MTKQTKQLTYNRTSVNINILIENLKTKLLRSKRIAQRVVTNCLHQNN